jgi:hypothetical protein
MALLSKFLIQIAEEIARFGQAANQRESPPVLNQFRNHLLLVITEIFLVFFALPENAKSAVAERKIWPTWWKRAALIHARVYVLIWADLPVEILAEVLLQLPFFFDRDLLFDLGLRFSGVPMADRFAISAAAVLGHFFNDVLREESD